jgi:hypothetical protein
MTKIYGVGQRVRCINGKLDPFVWEFVDEVPVEGGIYTTSRIFYEANGREIGDIASGLFFEEIPEGLPGYEGRICWEASRFDPIEDVDEARKRAAKHPRSRRSKKASTLRSNRHPVVA